MEKLNVPELNSSNYLVWSLKIKAALSLKRFDSVLPEVKPENVIAEKDATWKQKNSDTVTYIKLTISDEQALQFDLEENVYDLWQRMKSTFIGQVEDHKIDAGNGLKSIEKKPEESAQDYMARPRGIATKYHSLEADVSPRELL